MNQRANLVQRAARDMVQRLRVMLGSTGDDANLLVDQLDREVADNIAGDVCASLGIDYPFEDQSADGVKSSPNARRYTTRHPWARRGSQVGKHDK